MGAASDLIWTIFTVTVNIHYVCVRKMFSVVEFIDDQSCDVIPKSWFCDETERCCYWPPYRSSTAVNKAVRSQCQPMTDWHAYSVRKMGTAGNSHLILIYDLLFVALQFIDSPVMLTLVRFTETAHVLRIFPYVMLLAHFMRCYIYSYVCWFMCVEVCPPTVHRVRSQKSTEVGYS